MEVARVEQSVAVVGAGPEGESEFGAEGGGGDAGDEEAEGVHQFCFLQVEQHAVEVRAELFGEEQAVDRAGGFAGGRGAQFFLHEVRVHHAVVVLREEVRLKHQLLYVVLQPQYVVVFVAFFGNVLDDFAEGLGVGGEGDCGLCADVFFVEGEEAFEAGFGDGEVVVDQFGH